jgi:WD40 repeat protein
MPDMLNVTLAAFSADGRWLATGHTNGEVRVWDVGTGETWLLDETAHDEEVTALQFSRKGTLLVSGSQDGSLTRFNLTQLLDLRRAASPLTVATACSRANRQLSQDEWRRYFGDAPYQPSCAEIASAD